VSAIAGDLAKEQEELNKKVGWGDDFVINLGSLEGQVKMLKT